MSLASRQALVAEHDRPGDEGAVPKPLRAAVKHARAALEKMDADSAAVADVDAACRAASAPGAPGFDLRACDAALAKVSRDR